ncbi:uncharacterized protein LOC144104248 [Amblyomma americanum]
MPSVFILNPDHCFLDAAKAPKKHLFAGDGYHLSAGEGLEELAEILVRSLEKFAQTVTWLHIKCRLVQPRPCAQVNRCSHSHACLTAAPTTSTMTDQGSAFLNIF